MPQHKHAFIFLAHPPPKIPMICHQHIPGSFKHSARLTQPEATKNIIQLRSVYPQRIQHFMQDGSGGRLTQQNSSVKHVFSCQHTLCGFGHSPMIHFSHFLQPRSRSGYAFDNRRIDRLKQRNHLQPELVARKLALKIRTVSHVILTEIFQIIQYIFPIHAKQRTDHLSVHRTNPQQAVYSRASDQIHQKSFHAVIPVMSHRNHFRIHSFRHTGKPRIAQVTCGHFNGYPLIRGIARRIEICLVELYSQIFSQRNDKLLIAHRFFPAKMEIAMRSLAMIAQTKQDTKQRYRVCPAAQRHKHLVAFTEQALFLYECTYFLFKHNANI